MNGRVIIIAILNMYLSISCFTYANAEDIQFGGAVCDNFKNEDFKRAFIAKAVNELDDVKSSLEALDDGLNLEGNDSTESIEAAKTIYMGEKKTLEFMLNMPSNCEQSKMQ